MRLIFTLLAIASLPLLHGCAAVALGGAAAAGGYLVGEDQRAANTMAEDKGLELKIDNRITEKQPTAHVSVASYNRLALLTGEVPTAEVKADVESVARNTEGVRGVYNEVQIGPNSGFPARANDAYITSKVKARFVDARQFNALHVKVVTEARTVYLLGLVRRQVANAATELARTTTGVERVVRLFEYLD